VSEKKVLIFLIAFAIIIQNTCPYGWAAKTAFFSPYSSHYAHCPMKEDRQPAKSETRHNVKKDLSNINPLFVTDIGKPDDACQILSPIDHAPYAKSDHLKDVYLEPPLRPPVCSFSS
jgi:hypothetical protein